MAGLSHAIFLGEKKGVLYGPANDPQIETQNIPRPEMIPANGVAKNREWRGLHE